MLTQGAWTPAFLKFLFVAKESFSSLECMWSMTVVPVDVVFGSVNPDSKGTSVLDPKLLILDLDPLNKNREFRIRILDLDLSVN